MIVVNKSVVCNHYASGCTFLNKSFRYVSPQRVWFLRLLGLKSGTFCPFWSGIGYGFRGNNWSGWTYLSLQFQMKKKEREIYEFEIHFKKYFCSRSNLSRWHDFCKERGRPGLKMGVDFRRVYILPILVWNWVWFSRELRECMNIFVVSIPNEWEREKH